jgi:ArsR family transcriptional regulator
MAKRGRALTPEAIELVANRFKVLSEPLRLRLVNALERGERSVGELTEETGSTQPNVSKHLKILQEAGLIRRRQQGNTVYYSIADASVYEICDVVCQSIEERIAEQADVFRPRSNRAAR